MKLLYLILLLPTVAFSQYEGNTTPDYTQLIDQYRKCDNEHAEIQLYNMGKSDTEFPLYVCLINAGTSDSLLAFENARKGTTVLINNAIHPGEPDGVNASLLWIQHWIKNGKKGKDLPVIAIIPAYNVGGMLNRSGTSRANQDGPEVYGFRGNAQNLDLNRDFIKMDSQNARTFARIYHALDPDVFVDNHVSDGADYQYTLTLITSLKERLAPAQQNLMYNQLLPELTGKLKSKKIDWAPYVETKGEIPDSGIVAFNDLPRYAMGYARLFNALSFTVETHMLKPFPERVKVNLEFMEELFRWTGKNSSKIEMAKADAVAFQMDARLFSHHFKVQNNFEWMEFKGYEAKRKISEVTGMERLYYDRSQPFTRKIKYYNVSLASDSARIPEYYYVSAEAKKMIEFLRMNGVQMTEVLTRVPMKMNSLRLVSMKSGSNPYEGHYLHHSIEVREQEDTVVLAPGSMQISTNQPAINFILNVLEPEAEDSYFAWNFMDSYIQEKEYFSDYVFEEMALEILKENPDLKAEFEKKKASNTEFAKDAWAQLYFIYQHSDYFESKTFNRLPVFKVY